MALSTTSSDFVIVEKCYATIVGNTKMLDTLDRVLEVVPIDDPQNKSVKQLVLDSDRHIRGANLILSKFCGVLGAKEACWQSVDLRLCVMGIKLTPEQICESLQLSPCAQEFEHGLDELDKAWSDEAKGKMEELLSKFCDLEGGKQRAQNILELDDQKTKLMDDQAKTAKSIMTARHGNADTVGKGIEATSKLQWMEGQEKQSEKTRATLFNLKEDLERMKTEHIANANWNAVLDYSSSGMYRNVAVAARKEEQRAAAIADLKSSLPRCDTREFSDTKAKLKGEVAQFSAEMENEKMALNALNKKFTELDSQIDEIKTKIAQEQRAIAVKMKGVGAANQQHYAMMFGAVKEMRRQNHCVANGQTAVGTLLKKSIDAYDEAVLAFAHLPHEKQQVLLGHCEEGQRIGMFSKQLGFTSRVLMPLLDALTTVDHAQLPKVTDILEPHTVKAVKAALQTPAIRAPMQIGNPTQFTRVREIPRLLDSTPVASISEVQSNDSLASQHVSLGDVDVTPEPLTEEVPVSVDILPGPVDGTSDSVEENILGATPVDRERATMEDDLLAQFDF